MEMLEEAVEALKEGREPSLDQLLSGHTDIDLRVPTLLPDDYIPDVNMRLSLYKRIASADSQSALDDLKVELIDRFGLLPEPAKHLLALAAQRLRAAPLGIKRIEVGAGGALVEFTEHTKVDPMKVVGLLQSQPRIFKMDGPTKLRIGMPAVDAKARFGLLEQLLGQLGAA